MNAAGGATQARRGPDFYGGPCLKPLKRIAGFAHSARR